MASGILKQAYLSQLHRCWLRLHNPHYHSITPWFVAYMVIIGHGRMSIMLVRIMTAATNYTYVGLSFGSCMCAVPVWTSDYCDYVHIVHVDIACDIGIQQIQ